MAPGQRGSAVVETRPADDGIPPTTWPRIPIGTVTQPHVFHDGSRLDGEGNFFDREGAYAGHRDNLGNYYDGHNQVVGRVDSSDNYYDASGAYAGRRNDDGSFFDRTGGYNGRIDVSGNVYDRGGTKLGQINGVCDDVCKQDAVGRMLLAP